MSTGFFPFKLLYGHEFRGPLGILSELWQADQRGDESVVSRVWDMFEKTMMIANKSLEKSLSEQKKWYDKISKIREFKEGVEVLLLLPTATNKLLAQWQGPFTVNKKMSPVTYHHIEMPLRRKKWQIFHVNMLKKMANAVYFSASSEDEFSDDEFREWRDNSEGSQPV